MSTTKNLCDTLAQLPYADMKEIAKELSTAYENQDDRSIPATVRMAEALSIVSRLEIPVADVSLQEEKLLRRIFNRKRSMAISLEGKGWRVSIGTLGSHVLGTSLREAIRTCLDQLVVAEALNGDLRK
jgi:hypothetical protein